MSHAEGEETIAEGQDAHAEGYKTHGYGQASHAEGTLTWATGTHAHAEGYNTRAAGSASHASGIGTVATGEAQTVIGRNNTDDMTKAFIIGNGASASAKSNAVTVDWNGNAEFKGTVKSSGKTLATEDYVDAKDYATKNDVNAAFNNNYIRTGWDTISYENGTYFPTGTYATIEGHNNRALGIAAHAEGEGVWANGHYTHAEGYGTKATGDFAHVEGVSSVASGQVSHAEGTATTASGMYSHSQGESTVASGHASHAEGKGTIAAGTVQHVQGTFNIEDSEGRYIHIVGNGEEVMEPVFSGGLAIGEKPVQKRSNAHTIDWDGNAWFAGEIKIGGTSQEDAEAKTIATQDFATVTMETGILGSDETSIAKRYIFKQNGAEIGRIDLAKELVVTSGSVGTVTEADKPYAGAVVGDKYIDLAIANQEAHIYVPAKDLVDIYTPVAGATEVQITINDTNEISASLVDNGIVETKLSADVRTKLNKEWQPAGDYATKTEMSNQDAAILAEAQKYADSLNHEDTKYSAAENGGLKLNEDNSFAVAEHGVGASNIKAEKGYTGEDAEVWIFYCGSATELI